MKRFVMLFLFLFCGAAYADSFSSFTTRVNTESSDYSYHLQVADIVPAATATDVVGICGSATRTIRINRIQASADATAASVIDFYVYKRTTLNTGGTVTSPVAANSDSRDPTYTATTRLYSANPSALGTGVLFVADHYALPAATTTGYPGTPWSDDFGVRNDKAITLRGTSECLMFSLGGQAIPAGFLLYVNIAWTER